jgi:hypothetical protein
MRRMFAAVLWLTLVPAAAHGATVTSLSVNSDADNFLGKGIPRNAYGAGITSTSDDYGHGGAAVGAVATGEGMSLEVAPPPGEKLRPFNWTQVERYPFEEAPRPGLALTVGNRGCNVVAGRMEVLDVAFDTAGAPTRLWAIFDHHCEGSRSSAFGEVRWRAWVPDSAAHVTPGILRWPVTDGWWPAAPATVLYHGTAAAVHVAVAGDNSFKVLDDACTGHAPPCTVQVGFNPVAPGSHTARLEIADSAGATHATTLEGFLHGGTTSADIEVLDGDVAAPADDRGMHSYRPADSSFTGWEFSPNPVVRLHVDNRDDSHEWWNLDLYAGGGQKLKPGMTFSGAQGNADGPGPGVRVDGGPAWCNQTASAFTVNSMSYMPDGTLRSFDTSFERRCYDDKRLAARGTFKFRAGDDVALPDWLVPAPRPAIEVPAETPSAPAPSAPSSPVAPANTTVLARATPTGAVATSAAGVRLPRGCRAPSTARIWRGTRRADRLRGTARSDVIFGGRGNDVIRAGRGNDCVVGGPGSDFLIGGPGRDLLDCGPGRKDRVRADHRDRVRGCERRVR